MNGTTNPTYAVWYASAGCLPDSPYPEAVGSLEECQNFILEHAQDYARPDVEHDLYSLSISEYDVDEDAWM